MEHGLFTIFLISRIYICLLYTSINGLNSATIMKYLLDKPKMRVTSPTGLNLLSDNIISSPNQKIYLQLKMCIRDSVNPLGVVIASISACIAL